MKILAPLTAAAVLASTLAAPAQTIIVDRMAISPDRQVLNRDGTSVLQVRPVWSYQFDRSILHPIPRPFPWPGPNPCLSCPDTGFDERVTMPRELIAR